MHRTHTGHTCRLTILIMDQNTFNALLKDLIPHLYDLTVLETHPLTVAISPSDAQHGSRGKYMQHLILDAIKKLQPSNRSLNPSATEWRAYLILHRRYVEGIAPPTIATQLALSERQMRRDQSRALQALSGLLWNQLFASETRPSIQTAIQSPPTENPNYNESSPLDFNLHLESLNLPQTFEGVINTLRNRLKAEAVELKVDIPSAESMTILADRIILRQILLSLFNYALHLQADHLIQTALEQLETSSYAICIVFQANEYWDTWDADERQDLLETARSWGQRMNIGLQTSYPPSGQPGAVQIKLILPASSNGLILVIDDQQPAQRMYQRYLSRTCLKVIGIDDPTQAIQMARHLQPSLILLDVMMPHVDGWELLQALRQDPQTSSIPVIICSAWEASELARSLGAAEFLKKPVTQRDLLNTLQALGLSL